MAYIGTDFADMTINEIKTQTLDITSFLGGKTVNAVFLGVTLRAGNDFTLDDSQTPPVITYNTPGFLSSSPVPTVTDGILSLPISATVGACLYRLDFTLIFEDASSVVLWTYLKVDMPH